MAADISQRPELKLLDLGIEAKRQQVRQARSNLIEARAQYQINLTAYHRATGTL